VALVAWGRRSEHQRRGAKSPGKVVAVAMQGRSGAMGGSGFLTDGDSDAVATGKEATRCRSPCFLSSDGSS
jgi:hypothetical protein